MSAMVLAPAEMIREAHAVLHVAMEAPRCDAAEAAILALDDALETYRELDARALCWEHVYPHLAGQADPDDAALRKAAEEAGAMAEALVKVMAAHHGQAAGIAS